MATSTPASATRQVTTDPVIDVLSELTGKLDTIIELLRPDAQQSLGPAPTITKALPLINTIWQECGQLYEPDACPLSDMEGFAKILRKVDSKLAALLKDISPSEDLNANRAPVRGDVEKYILEIVSLVSAIPDSLVTKSGEIENAMAKLTTMFYRNAYGHQRIPGAYDAYGAFNLSGAFND